MQYRNLPIDIKVPGLDQALGRVPRRPREANRFRVSSGTRSERERGQRAEMVRDLARRLMWPLLRAILTERLTVEEVYAAYRQGDAALSALINRADNQELRPLLDRYIRQKGTRHRESVRRQIERFLDFLGPLATTADFTTERVKEFLGSFEASNATKNRYLAALQGFARSLYTGGYMPTHPLATGAVERYEESEGRINLLSGKEKVRYFELMEQENRDLVTFYRVLMWSGADVSELVPTNRTNELALRVSDCLLDLRQPKLKLKRHKVKKSPVRLVPIPKEVAADLRGWIAYHQLQDGDFVFGMLSDEQLINAHERVRAEMGREDFRRKDFRHVAAVQWLQAGFTLQDVQRFLGHSNISQTAVYTAWVVTDDWQEPRVDAAWEAQQQYEDVRAIA